jgi:hypothetical protein
MLFQHTAHLASTLSNHDLGCALMAQALVLSFLTCHTSWFYSPCAHLYFSKSGTEVRSTRRCCRLISLSRLHRLVPFATAKRRWQLSIIVCVVVEFLCGRSGDSAPLQTARARGQSDFGHIMGDIGAYRSKALAPLFATHVTYKTSILNVLVAQAILRGLRATFGSASYSTMIRIARGNDKTER